MCQGVVGAGLGLAIACAALFDRALKASTKERKKENVIRDTAHHANAPTPENPVSNRAQPERSALRGPTGAGPAASAPPPPPIFDALVRCATTSLRYVRWRDGATPTRDSSFFTAYTPLRYRYAVFLSRHLARQISALTQVQLAASVRSSSSGAAAHRAQPFCSRLY